MEVLTLLKFGFWALLGTMVFLTVLVVVGGLLSAWADSKKIKKFTGKEDE